LDKLSDTIKIIRIMTLEYRINITIVLNDLLVV